MSTRWGRPELSALVATRKRNAAYVEGQGDSAFIEVRIRVTPELLEAFLGARVVQGDRETIFDGVWLDDDGYAEPILTETVHR